MCVQKQFIYPSGLQFGTTPLPKEPTVEDLFFLVFANYQEYSMERGVLWLGIATSYLFLPGFVSALLALPVSLAWRRPLRILVLRRFGARKRSRGLRRALRQCVAPVGHVYTLADRDFKTPWYIRFPVIFAQLVFLHFRERRVRSLRGIRRVSSSLDVRWARNVNWVVSSSKTFSLRSSDTVWRDLVRSLTAKVEAVLIDVHEGSPNLEWEIRKCAEEDYLDKTMFLTSGDRRKEAVSLLAKLGLGHLTGEKLVAYDTGELEEDARLRAFIESRQASKPRVSHARLASQLKAASVMIGPILWGLILLITLNAFFGEDNSTKENRFEALVARLRQEPTRDAAFEDLRRVSAISGTKHTSPWIDDFERAVIPLLKELWEADPGRRREILAVLKDTGSPDGAEIWRRALADAERLDFLESDDVVGLWIREGNTERLRAGQVLAQPGALTAHYKFEAWAYLLSEEEGGLRNLLFGTFGGVQDEKAAFSPGSIPAIQFRNAFVSTKKLNWKWQVDTSQLSELFLADKSIYNESVFSRTSGFEKTQVRFFCELIDVTPRVGAKSEHLSAEKGF